MKRISPRRGKEKAYGTENLGRAVQRHLPLPADAAGGGRRHGRQAPPGLRAVSGLSPGVHKSGEVYNAGGQTWECIQNYDNGVYPDIAPGGSAWGAFHRPLHGTGPETARPFVPVTGAHDTYQMGEYVWFEGALYQCLSEMAYSPAEYPAAWALDVENKEDEA